MRTLFIFLSVATVVAAPATPAAESFMGEPMECVLIYEPFINFDYTACSE